MPKWENGASPAAAAGVSRILSDAGMVRSTLWDEGKLPFRAPGFYASPRNDYVRVEWEGAVPDDPHEKAVLARCRAILLGKGYDVVDTTARLSVPGGWRDGPVLEVRPR